MPLKPQNPCGTKGLRMVIQRRGVQAKKQTRACRRVPDKPLELVGPAGLEPATKGL